MRIETQDYNEVTVVTLQGELDNDSMEMLKNEVMQTVSKSSSGIVLDMSSVSFVDSQGLEQLLWTRDYCNENRCEFRLAGLDENCTKILEITRIEKEFDHYAELSEAVKSFA